MQLLPAARKTCAVAIGKNIRKTKPLALTSPSAPLTWKGGGGLSWNVFWRISFSWCIFDEWQTFSEQCDFQKKERTITDVP